MANNTLPIEDDVRTLPGHRLRAARQRRTSHPIARPFRSSCCKFFVLGLFVIGSAEYVQQAFQHRGIALLGGIDGELGQIVAWHELGIVRIHA